MSELKKTITSAVKDAMRAKDKPRLGVLRMVQAEFKRIEVDERIELDDARVLAVLDKMLKQRKDSAQQFRDAERVDLAEQEELESAIIQEFLPKALSEDEVSAIIDEAIQASGAESARDMGKVMALVKPQIQGRGDMGAASQLVKAKLA